jgi:predicted DNA-binding WGR domain protein
MTDKQFINIILILVFGLTVSCNSSQTSATTTTTTTVPIKNYFKTNGEIMLKLYKSVNNEMLYWETWNTAKSNVVVHWGKLGDIGENKAIHKNLPRELQAEINNSIEAKVKEGFREIPFEEQYTLQINFRLKTWGNEKDLDRREEVRNIVTDHLGWTGNGRCDDGDIGSGEMSLFAEVIDPYLAIKTLTKEFKDKNISDEYYFTIIKGNRVIKDKIKPE